MDEEGRDEELPIKTQAVRLGVSETMIRRAREHGLDPYQADRLCSKGLGLHPVAIYGFNDWVLADDIRIGEDGMPLDNCEAAQQRRRNARELA